MSIRAVMKAFERIADVDEKTALLDPSQDSMEIPPPTFTLARTDAAGRRVPQAIAHRGYKAAHPENTMGAFRGAVQVGAHAIETDIHLSKDGIVVLSHDATLERCFGHKEKIIDCNWSYLSTLKTLKEPSEHLPRLLDLLHLLAEPGNENIWLLLDIKLDNNADDVMRLIADTINSVTPSTPWRSRVVLGCWAAKYLPLCDQYLPGFPITHIGFSTAYARQFLRIPHVSFNMLQKIMVGPCGARFLADCKRQKRAVFLWTVNEARWMRWAINKEVDGVITDDPKKYLEVIKDLHADQEQAAKNGTEVVEERMRVRELLGILWIQTLVLIFGALFRWRYGGKAERPRPRIVVPDVKLKGRVAA